MISLAKPQMYHVKCFNSLDSFLAIILAFGVGLAHNAAKAQPNSGSASEF